MKIGEERVDVDLIIDSLGVHPTGDQFRKVPPDRRGVLELHRPPQVYGLPVPFRVRPHDRTWLP
jgi:hypothetical protein